MFLLNKAKKTILCWVLAILPPLIFVPTVHLTTNFGLSNTCLVPGALYLGGLILVFVARQGFFDIFAYQFVNLASSFRKGAPKKYEDAYAYKVAKEEKRRNGDFIWLPFALVGLLFLVLAIIFIFYPL